MVTTVLGDIPSFLEYIFTELERLGLDVSAYFLDHLCYRVDTADLYEEKKKQMLSHAKLLSEALISGRPIATFELNEPILFRERSIGVVEIPHPKAGIQVKTGLEHVEFVIDEDFKSFLNRYSHLSFDQSGLAKQHNPELELKFVKANVKFHRVSLREAIARESSPTPNASKKKP